jgi:L-serine dehydratase
MFVGELPDLPAGLPAVARYYENFIEGVSTEGLFRFFLTAGAIGILYKENASISGAEVGCQGEGGGLFDGAGGLAAALGGTNQEVEYAADGAQPGDDVRSNRGPSSDSVH